MSIVYFDSSALVKLVLDETGSELAAQLWNGCDAALSSRLAYPEVRAALGAAARRGDLSESQVAVAATEWEIFWASMRPVELTAHVERSAGELASLHHLRGADAVHLASAVAVGQGGLIVAAWDRRLHAGVIAAGLSVAPAIID